MQWVFDASVTMAWCFEDERTPATEALLDRLSTTPAIVPQVWPLEVANVLVVAARKNRITPTLRAQFLTTLTRLPIHLDGAPMQDVFSALLPLAETCGLTVYDAGYLELAMRLGIPLATLDRELGEAARRVGVSLL